MAAIVRSMDLAADAEGVVALYKRNHFGFALNNGFDLTPDVYRRMIAENGPARYFVAEDEGQIVGLVGLTTIDRARSSRPGEIRAAHFLVESSARGSLVGGQLFDATSPYLFEHGLGTIRLRVHPDMTAAIGMYLKGGFRALGSVHGDQFSSIELTSHLPRVITAVRRVLPIAAAEGYDVPEDLPWTLIKGVRTKSMDDGVEVDPDGTVRLTYTLQLREHRVGVTVDGDTGRILRMVLDGADVSDVFLAMAGELADGLPPRPAARVDVVRQVGRFTVGVDDQGAIRVTHPEHLGELVTDFFPVADGTLVATALPPLRDVTTTLTATGWETTEAGSGLTRTVTLTDYGFRVECRRPTTSPGPLAVAPVVGLRTAESRLTLPGAPPLKAPVRPGLWPVLLPLNEAAGDATTAVAAEGATQTWVDQTAGLAVSVKWLDPGILRQAGECRAPGQRLRYRVRLTEAPETPPRPPKRPPLPPVAWTEARNHLVTGEGPATLDVDPARGLELWRHADAVVLQADHRRVDLCHALSSVPAAIWPCLNTDRGDLERGPEWGFADDRWRFSASVPKAPEAPTWWLTASADLGAVDLGTAVPGGFAGQEAALWLRPSGLLRQLWMANSAGRLYLADCFDEALSRPTWWGFTRRVGVPLPDGRVLDITPAGGPGAEIFVRGMPAGFIIALLSRVKDTLTMARWRLEIMDTAPEPAEDDEDWSAEA
jgi:ribosomal protein S18 acetylase RimI-like enzyme